MNIVNKEIKRLRRCWEYIAPRVSTYYATLVRDREMFEKYWGKKEKAWPGLEERMTFFCDQTQPVSPRRVKKAGVPDHRSTTLARQGQITAERARSNCAHCSVLRHEPSIRAVSTRRMGGTVVANDVVVADDVTCHTGAIGVPTNRGNHHVAM